MQIVQNKFDEILNKKNLSRYELNKIINYYESDLNKMIKGQKHFPDHIIEKIAPILDVSVNEIKIWILADKYSKEVLELAVKVKKESKGSDKLILTTKIDEILQSRNMSRTQLSKLAKYDQSSVNKMLTGKSSVSKTVLTKLSITLEIPENEIKSWIVADKYPLKVIESALTLL